MTKLLATYRADPSLKNAQKVAANHRKHPMAACLLAPEDADLLVEALRQVAYGE